MTVRNVFDHYVKLLSAVYEKNEAEKITEWIIEDLLGITKTDLILHDEKTISEVKANDLAWKLLRLARGEPVQYVLGYTHFFGLKLKVDRSVLIPRPETEELVEWIIEEHQNKSGLKILDVGTGSGCIAIALKKNLPGADIHAIDISEKALKVANENSMLNEVTINFMQGDILESSFANSQYLSGELQLPYSLIISNPPYVLEMEKTGLHKNVLEYEPSEALFVPDSDPLLFYKAIIAMAQKILSGDGSIYFEVNAIKTREVADLLVNAGYGNAEVRNDISGNPRMVRGSR